MIKKNHNKKILVILNFKFINIKIMYNVSSDNYYVISVHVRP